MEYWTYALAALAPSLFWLWVIRHRDDFEPEPKIAVFTVFGLGFVSAVLVLQLRGTIDAWFLPDGPEEWRDRVDAFLITAPFEELAKGSAFLIGAWWRRHLLNEPLDGIVYGTAAALGFASFENFIYLRWNGDYEILLFRAFTSTLLHVGCSGLLGYFLGLLHFRHWSFAPWLVTAGVAASVLPHGLYDYLLFRNGPLAITALIVVLPCLIVALGLQIHWNHVRSMTHHLRYNTGDGEPT